MDGLVGWLFGLVTVDSVTGTDASGNAILFAAGVDSRTVVALVDWLVGSAKVVAVAGLSVSAGTVPFLAGVKSSAGLNSSAGRNSGDAFLELVVSAVGTPFVEGFFSSIGVGFSAKRFVLQGIDAFFAGGIEIGTNFVFSVGSVDFGFLPKHEQDVIGKRPTHLHVLGDSLKSRPILQDLC